MTTTTATYCAPCDATVCAIPSDVKGVLVLVEYEADGFTPSPDRHVCRGRDAYVGHLIEQRRARGVQVVRPRRPEAPLLNRPVVTAAA